MQNRVIALDRLRSLYAHRKMMMAGRSRMRFKDEIYRDSSGRASHTIYNNQTHEYLDAYLQCVYTYMTSSRAGTMKWLINKRRIFINGAGSMWGKKKQENQMWSINQISLFIYVDEEGRQTRIIFFFLKLRIAWSPRRRCRDRSYYLLLERRAELQTEVRCPT